MQKAKKGTRDFNSEQSIMNKSLSLNNIDINKIKLIKNPVLISELNLKKFCENQENNAKAIKDTDNYLNLRHNSSIKKTCSKPKLESAQ